MQVITDLASCPHPEKGCAVSIGVYDGVHLGHRLLIEKLKQEAKRLSIPSAVVTFDPHPATVVRPESAPKLLSPLSRKLELLSETGIDYVVVIKFDKNRAKETAEEFISQVILGCLHSKVVVIGQDFRFGYKRAGDVDLLKKVGETSGFEVVPFGLVQDLQDGQPISSTRIRDLIKKGDVDSATKLLKRPPEVIGEIVHGDARGAKLGFPTANFRISKEVLVPRIGIYAGFFKGEDAIERPAAISVGIRPTFYENKANTQDEELVPLVEAYVLDFNGNLYGQKAKLTFNKRLRDERQFDSSQDLVTQMEADIEYVRSIL